MKKLSILICFVFSFNVMASPLSEIEKSLDDYNYAMTVEWDQKDAKFFEEKTEAFYEAIRLGMENGVTQNDLLALAESKVKSQQDLAALKLKLTLLSREANSSHELADILKNNSAGFYHRGASWDGETWGTIGWVALGVALLGYAIWFASKYECVASERRRDCETKKRSNGSEYKDCGYKTVCTDYAERNP